MGQKRPVVRILGKELLIGWILIGVALGSYFVDETAEPASITGNDPMVLNRNDSLEGGFNTLSLAEIYTGTEQRTKTVIDIHMEQKNGYLNPNDGLRVEYFQISSEGTSHYPFSADTPSVFITSPNGGEHWRGTNSLIWTATDPQNDPLTFTVYYSPDGGITWILIATGLIKPFYSWDTTTVEDGTTYLIKVEAHDGLYTGMDVSDAPFEITNEQSLFDRLFHNLQTRMALVLVGAAISVLTLLGAALKAASFPPLRVKGSGKDFLQRLLWYLL